MAPFAHEQEFRQRISWHRARKLERVTVIGLQVTLDFSGFVIRRRLRRRDLLRQFRDPDIERRQLQVGQRKVRGHVGRYPATGWGGTAMSESAS